MITVLHVIDTGGPGGAETVFLNISTGLDSLQFRSICVVSHEGWLTESLRTRGNEPLIVAARGSFNFNYLRQLRALIRKHGVDIIVAHLYGSAIYCSLAGMLEQLPVISVLHGQNDITGKGRLAWLKRWLTRKGSTQVVFVSERLKQSIAPALALPDQKCVVIANGIDISKFSVKGNRQLREELKVAPNQVLVGAVGNIRQPKAYDVFLKAAAILQGRSGHYRFAIAGEGSGPLFEELKKLRSQLKLESTLAFLGLRSDVAAVLQSYDVYVLSSKTEGFSIACVEAMASGVPVVATRSGGPEEIITHEHSGLLVPTGDPAALASAIERLAVNPDLARRLISNGVRRVGDKYTLSSMLLAYEELFAKIAINNRISDKAARLNLNK